MTDKKDLKKTGDVILDEGTPFEIKGFGKFRMKYLKLGTLIKISTIGLKLQHAGEDATLLSIIGTARKNAKPSARIVAISLMNSWFKIFLFSRLFAVLLLWKLTAAELKVLVELMLSKSGADDFFLSTTLIKGMNVLENQKANQAEQPKVEKQSGEKLPN